MASKLSKTLWQKAIRLSEAWLDLAPIDLRLEYQGSDNLKLSNFSLDSKSMIGRGLEFVGQYHLMKTRKDQLENQLKAELEAAILKGEYALFGYREIPSRSNGPVEIDTSVSKSVSLDWSEESIVVHQTKYNRVGILSKATVDEYRKVKLEFDSNESNSALAIDNAIEQLKIEIPAFGARSRKADYSAIIEFLKVDPEQDYGYSFSKVCKAIVRNCGKKR